MDRIRKQKRQNGALPPFPQALFTATTATLLHSAILLTPMPIQVLPAELWLQIIRQIPSDYQRSCLSVSKLLHDISLQCVFLSINVRLGLVRDLYLADEERWCPWTSQEKAEADTAIRRSCELLQHIVRSPSGPLTQAVKYVSVRAYSPDASGEVLSMECMGMSVCFFFCAIAQRPHLDTLEQALSVLRLRRFAWYGCHPMPRQQVFEALSTASCETMEDITLP